MRFFPATLIIRVKQLGYAQVSISYDFARVETYITRVVDKSSHIAFERGINDYFIVDYRFGSVTLLFD